MLSDTGSQAWLAFSIKPKPNLPQQTQITNTAYIYFDHNSPVGTNTTLHTIGGPESVIDISSNEELSVMPNPFGSQTKIRLTGLPDGPYTYTISDILGRQVISGSMHVNTDVIINRNQMTAGVYLLGVYQSGSPVAHTSIVAY